MLTLPMDIITDPSHSRTMGPDMAFCSSPGVDVTMASVAAQATRISMSLVAAWLSNTNMVPGV